MADETVLMNQAAKEKNLAQLLTLNSSAKLLFEELSGKDFCLEDAAKILMEVYHIPHEQALGGAEVWIESMKQYSVIE